MSQFLDEVFQEVAEDIVTVQNVVFRGNNVYEGSINSFSSFPIITTYVEPTQDGELAPKKYVDDHYVSLTDDNVISGDNKFTGLHETHNLLLRAPTGLIGSKIEFKSPVVNTANSSFNDALMTSITSDVENEGRLIIKQHESYDIEFVKPNDVVLAKIPIESGSPIDANDIVTLGFTDNRYVQPSSSITWTGAQTFNTSLPTSTITPTTTYQLANKSYVDSSISALVASAPTTLDTLNELSNALGSDPNFSTTITTLIGTKAPINDPVFTGTVSGITKAMVSLGNAENTTDLNKPISTATQNALDSKANLNGATFTGTVSGITKSMVGLANVDNTTDLNKPISTEVQLALDLKANITYVDTSIANLVASAPTTLDTLNELALALGNDPNYATSTATLIGTKAPINNPTFTGTVSGITKAMVSLGNVDNTTDLNKPISTATQFALDLKANLANPTFTGTLACASLTPSGLITSTLFTENMTSITHSSNVYTLNFNSGNVFFGDNPSANFTVNIIGIPTSSSTKQFTFSLVLNTGTFICTSASATDTSATSIVSSATPKNAGGSAPVVGTSSVVIHSFTVVQCFATKFILYNVNSFN